MAPPVLPEWRETMARVAWISLGGIVGANLRYFLGGWVQGRLGVGFPWGTLAINLTGSFLLGMLMGLVTGRYATPYGPTLRLAVGIGCLGAYTTFSTFTYETLMLAEEALWARALTNVGASVILGLAAAWLGLKLGRIL